MILYLVGKYRAEQHIPQSDSYRENPQLSLEIIVEQLPQKKVIKHQKGASSGEFSFTAGQSGSYSICLSTSDKGGWFSHDKARVYLDIVLGDSAMEINGVNGGSSHDEKLSEMAMRVRDLNHRIADIRREQSFQRVREAEFRDRSESTNAKAVWWTIVQMFMLGLTALWQVRHLKGFFEKKKLV